jgi:outer membrane receptor protein involved in Fe transport
VGAQVSLMAETGAELQRTETNEQGWFSFQKLSPASYVIAISKTGFRELRRTVQLTPGQVTAAAFTLDVGVVLEAVTITPARGEAQQVFDTPESVSVSTDGEMSRRAFLILPQALKEEPGVHLQQTTPSQGSPIIRGLTGQQVVNLIDGVRYNNSTFRPGPNQYTALIDPFFAERVEIVRGPNSTQYGSDSLGGTVNVLTGPTGALSDRLEMHGEVSTFFGSADLSGGGGVRLSGGARNWGFTVAGTGRRAQDLRAGGDIDSHAAVTRFLGLSSKILGDRLQDTAYSQYGANAKFVYHSGQADTFTFEYLRGTQLGARRYDQLNGGNGNLLNRFDPQVLDFAIARYDRLGLGFLDSLSAIFSFNGQRDDRTFQNVNNEELGLRSKITDEFNRTNVFGYQAQATTHLGGRNSIAFGGEVYDEYITSRRRELNFSEASGGFTEAVRVRARFPNGARYNTLGLFAQDVVDLIPHRLSGTFGVRYSNFRYSQSPHNNPLNANGETTVPPFRTSIGDTTFNTGLVFSVNEHLNLTANISRGFRAPNVSDLGAIGLSTLGFEISPEEGKRLGGLIGSFASSEREEAEKGPSTNNPIQPLKAEKLYSYEVGLKLRSSRLGGTLAVFDSEVTDLIERRVVVLPPGGVGQLIGGQPIIRQDETGAVFTALSNTPVLVRANAGRVRFRGIEGSLWLRLTHDLTLNTNGFYIRGTDLETGHPPALEGGIPPATGFLSLKWEPLGKRYWVEAYSNFAYAQRRFSDEDFEEARIGGIRDRQEIASFFNNGAVARGLVRNGILLPTGETLDQVWRRVLGPNPEADIPLFNKMPGYATFNLRMGSQIAENSTIMVILENIFDKNYRTMGSGVDAPGINLLVRYQIRF